MKGSLGKAVKRNIVQWIAIRMENVRTGCVYVTKAGQGNIVKYSLASRVVTIEVSV